VHDETGPNPDQRKSGERGCLRKRAEKQPGQLRTFIPIFSKSVRLDVENLDVTPDSFETVCTA
jgi:hypothetical protein